MRRSFWLWVFEWGDLTGDPFYFTRGHATMGEAWRAIRVALRNRFGNE